MDFELIALPYFSEDQIGQAITRRITIDHHETVKEKYYADNPETMNI